MHIQSKTGKLINCTYINDVKAEGKNVVLYYLNGTKQTEGVYTTEQEAEDRASEIKIKLLS